MTDSLLRWTVDKLKHSFGLEASDDIVQYILSIDNADEIVEYKDFVDELVQRCQMQAPDGLGGVYKKEAVMGKYGHRCGCICFSRTCSFCVTAFVFCAALEATEHEYLPHKEAKMKAGLEKAVKHKDILLEFDRNSVKRTQVLDDESDYFATDSNQWLSPGEREALHHKIKLDFAGRRVLDEGENLTPYYQKFDETVKAINTGSFGQTPKHSVSTDRQNLRELVNPNIMQAAPEWVDVSGSDTSHKSSSKKFQVVELFRYTHTHSHTKRVEGRTWYTSHRGRLWIAAAANRPSPQEIAEVVAMYRHIYKEEPKFPMEYPTGCLLGCVNVSDCLSQEQFREQYPQIGEETTSPFVFICSNPQELVVKFPMKGKHKICKSCLTLFMCGL
uniref:Thyroid hormone receptor interactor 4 n=1 Tax=Cyprinus carpio carpio TaxID=630221 RepID=A0A8C1FKX6_CYPCA